MITLAYHGSASAIWLDPENESRPLSGAFCCPVTSGTDAPCCPRHWRARPPAPARKRSHRISGRPVWDRLFFRRVLARASKPRSRPTVHRDLSSSSLWTMRQARGRRPYFPVATLYGLAGNAAIAAENAAIAFPVGRSGTDYSFGGSSRGSRIPITTTVHQFSPPGQTGWPLRPSKTVALTVR